MSKKSNGRKHRRHDTQPTRKRREAATRTTNLFCHLTVDGVYAVFCGLPTQMSNRVSRRIEQLLREPAQPIASIIA